MSSYQLATKTINVVAVVEVDCFRSELITGHFYWDEWLDQAVFAYNTSVHESTGFAPYEMVFGRPARMPIEVELGVPLQNPFSQSDYSRSLRNFIQLANVSAEKNLSEARNFRNFYF